MDSSINEYGTELTVTFPYVDIQKTYEIAVQKFVDYHLNNMDPQDSYPRLKISLIEIEVNTGEPTITTYKHIFRASTRR